MRVPRVKERADFLREFVFISFLITNFIFQRDREREIERERERERETEGQRERERERD